MRARIALLMVCFAWAAMVAVSAADNMVFILDASNSMNKAFGDSSRLEAAKGSLKTILSGLPDGESIGILAYGHRIGKDNEVESCQDIEFLFDIAELDSERRESISLAVDAITAQGMTPLADSLVAAANELATLPGSGAIILISDGEGNCGGQQEIVAAMLSTMNPPMVLHVIGLDVEDEARDTLMGMALQTNGTYRSVYEVGGLLDALYSVLSNEDEMQAVPAIPSDYERFGVTNIIYGTEGDDVLYGTPENDLILGLGGNDFLIGLDGDDVLCGGPGNDILEGVKGNDRLDGEDGDDLLFGGAGDDILCGGPGNDSMEGEAGNDVMDGGLGVDTLLGGGGMNILYAADGVDVLMEGKIMPGSSDQCPICCMDCPPEPDCLPVVEPVKPACPPTDCAPPPPPPVETVEPVCTAPPVVKTVNEGESIQLHGTVADSDCNVIQHLWQAAAGGFDDAGSLDPIYTAPMLDGCEDLDVEIVLTAVDSCGASASDAFILHVVNVNHVPVLELGEPLVVDEGMSLVLMPEAYDPDGDPLVYQWGVNGNWGTIDENGIFTAPLIDACDGVEIIVTLSVIDPCGAMVCDSVSIFVRNVNAAPMVDLGPDFALDEGLVIQLTPVVNDPDCDQLRYCWSSTKGSFDNPASPTPMFSVPLSEYCDGEELTLTLTVTDPCGLTATDSVDVHVNNLNAAPFIDLGPDFCVVECSSTLITPMVGDPDHDALVYTWSISGGALDSYCSAAAVFSAPATENCDGETVTLTVTVTDPCGLSATDSILLRIDNVNQPPRVHADP